MDCGGLEKSSHPLHGWSTSADVSVCMAVVLNVTRLQCQCIQCQLVLSTFKALSEQVYRLTPCVKLNRQVKMGKVNIEI